jgi:hypothetical protein
MFLFEESVVDIIALKDRIIYKDSDNYGNLFFFSPKLLNSVAFYNEDAQKFLPRGLGKEI